MSSNHFQHVNTDLVMRGQRCNFEGDNVPLIVQRSQMSVHSDVGVCSGQITGVLLQNCAVKCVKNLDKLSKFLTVKICNENDLK